MPSANGWNRNRPGNKRKKRLTARLRRGGHHAAALARRTAGAGATRASGARGEQLREQIRQQLNLILETRENGARADCKYGRRPVRLRQVHPEAGNAGEARQSVDIIWRTRTEIQGGGPCRRSGAATNTTRTPNGGVPVGDYLGLGRMAGTNYGGRTRKNSAVADNSTPSGRQQNRRVELVVSGDPIGAGSSTTGELHH